MEWKNLIISSAMALFGAGGVYARTDFDYPKVYQDLVRLSQIQCTINMVPKEQWDDNLLHERNDLQRKYKRLVYSQSAPTLSLRIQKVLESFGDYNNSKVHSTDASSSPVQDSSMPVQKTPSQIVRLVSSSEKSPSISVPSIPAPIIPARSDGSIVAAPDNIKNPDNIKTMAKIPDPKDLAQLVKLQDEIVRLFKRRSLGEEFDRAVQERDGLSIKCGITIPEFYKRITPCKAVPCPPVLQGAAVHVKDTVSTAQYSSVSVLPAVKNASVCVKPDSASSLKSYPLQDKLSSVQKELVNEFKTNRSSRRFYELVGMRDQLQKINDMYTTVSTPSRAIISTPSKSNVPTDSEVKDSVITSDISSSVGAWLIDIQEQIVILAKKRQFDKKFYELMGARGVLAEISNISEKSLVDYFFKARNSRYMADSRDSGLLAVPDDKTIHSNSGEKSGLDKPGTLEDYVSRISGGAANVSRFENPIAASGTTGSKVSAGKVKPQVALTSYQTVARDRLSKELGIEEKSLDLFILGLENRSFVVKSGCEYVNISGLKLGKKGWKGKAIIKDDADHTQINGYTVSVSFDEVLRTLKESYSPQKMAEGIQANLLIKPLNPVDSGTRLGRYDLKYDGRSLADIADRMSSWYVPDAKNQILVEQFSQKIIGGLYLGDLAPNVENFIRNALNKAIEQKQVVAICTKGSFPYLVLFDGNSQSLITSTVAAAGKKRGDKTNRRIHRHATIAGVDMFRLGHGQAVDDGIFTQQKADGTAGDAIHPGRWMNRFESQTVYQILKERRNLRTTKGCIVIPESSYSLFKRYARLNQGYMLVAIAPEPLKEYGALSFPIDTEDGYGRLFRESISSAGTLVDRLGDIVSKSFGRITLRAKDISLGKYYSKSSNDCS